MSALSPLCHLTPITCHIFLHCRIQTYLQSTRPIIDLYEKQGKVHTIDASRSVDEVSKQRRLQENIQECLP